MGWSSWWSRLFPSSVGAVPNTNPVSSVGPAYNPGDEHGVTIDPPTGNVQTRMATIIPSGFDGWPANWASPSWSGGSQYEELIDTAWAALDLNSSVLSAMPVYRTRNGQILPPTSWMTNPDPTIYSSWAEFAKQLFWDFQLGEVFVLPMARGADGWPVSFRVIPAPFVTVEMNVGRRVYTLGGPGGVDVTDDILHIRYKSRTDAPRGCGPLESGRTRVIAAGMLAQYVTELADGGFVPKYALVTEQRLNRTQSEELLEQWWASRMQNFGERWKPGVLSGGVKPEPIQMTPEDMSLVELAKFSDARIAVLLGVPPVLLGLPSGEDSMTYKNVESLFDFHDRAGLRPKVVHVMQALSGWALPRGQSVELNRDEYTRPPLNERADAYAKLAAIPGVITGQEIRTMERFIGEDAAVELTGGD